MRVNDDYLRWVLEQLAEAGSVACKRMFGGMGLYLDGIFFAIISADTLYFKVDDHTRVNYTARGMAPFRPYKNRPDVSLTYYEVPADVLEDPAECAAWARRAALAITGKIRRSSKSATP